MKWHFISNVKSYKVLPNHHVAKRPLQCTTMHWILMAVLVNCVLRTSWYITSNCKCTCSRKVIYFSMLQPSTKARNRLKWNTKQSSITKTVWKWSSPNSTCAASAKKIFVFLKWQCLHNGPFWTTMSLFLFFWKPPFGRSVTMASFDPLTSHTHLLSWPRITTNAGDDHL